jgi:putative holliday junction resolvase
MGRILGLDYGEVRIGVAISDTTKTIANAKGYIDQRKADCIEEIISILKDNDIERIVIGLPLNLKGKYTQKTREVKDFSKKLKKSISIPVDMWDERLSTVSAERTLRESNIKAKKQRNKIDSVAAQIILQNYLDSKKM